MSGICLLVLLVIRLRNLDDFMNHEYIVWNEDKKISWEDFQGYPATWVSISAVFNGDINYKMDCDSPHYNIFAYMNTNKAWARNFNKSDHVLNHEQRHFDIREIGARQLRRAIGKFPDPCLIDPDTVEQLYKQIAISCAKLDYQYDEDTRWKENWRIWDRKIDSMLLDLSPYK